jgi:hypothetical protein
MEISAHGSPLYAVETYISLHGFRRFVVDQIKVSTSDNTSQCHSQINSYMTVEVSVLFGNLMKHDIGVVDYGSGSAPRLAYRNSETSPLNS